MTPGEPQLHFPPPIDRKVFGIFRPAQVASVVGGITAAMLAFTQLPLGGAVATTAVASSLSIGLGVLRVKGDSLERVLAGVLWLRLPPVMVNLVGPTRSRDSEELFIATIHHGDRYLAEGATQWQVSTEVGQALAAGALAMGEAVQLLTVRRFLLSRATRSAIGDEGVTHEFQTLLVSRATEGGEIPFRRIVKVLREHGAQCGEVVRCPQPLAGLGPVRRTTLQWCSTRTQHVSVRALTSGPTLPVGPTALVELFVDPPWAMFAVTVCPVAPRILQRRIERRMTAAAADVHLLERSGFRWSAAQQSQQQRSVEYEAAIARGERPALVHLHVACVGEDVAQLSGAEHSLLARAERCGLTFTSLWGRHHVGLTVFGNPSVLTP